MGRHCNDPDCYRNHHGQQEAAARIRRDIARVGWSVVGILGTPSFAYTVGLTTKRLPELYFTLDVPGTLRTLEVAKNLLNAAGHHIVTHNLQPRHGMTIALTDTDHQEWKVLFETRLHTTPLTKAREMYGSRLRVLELDLVD